MYCPRCRYYFTESDIKAEAARLWGKSARRTLTREQAQEMNRKSLEAKKRKKNQNA